MMLGNGAIPRQQELGVSFPSAPKSKPRAKVASAPKKPKAPSAKGKANKRSKVDEGSFPGSVLLLSAFFFFLLPPPSLPPPSSLLPALLFPPLYFFSSVSFSHSVVQRPAKEGHMQTKVGTRHTSRMALRLVRATAISREREASDVR